MKSKMSEVNKIKCSNCGALLGESIRRFCEFCGFELYLQVKKENEPIKDNSSQKTSRRRHCC